MRSTLMSVVWVMALAASSGTRAEECNRACLSGLVDRYVAGMLAHDPQRVPWAAHVGFYGVVAEGSKTSVFGLRLKVEDGKISEAESIVARPRETRPDFPNPGALKDKPVFAEIEPVQQRATREQLIAVADSYFNTLQQNDGRVLVPFDKDCNRVEDGVQTTNNPQRASSSGNGFPALGCEAQFKTGYFHFVTRIRDRRFPVVDVERGLVLVSTFFDHTGSLRKVTLSNGKTRDIGAPFDEPYSFVIFELFKVRNGKIRQVEAVLEDVPYSTQSAWMPRAPGPPPSVEQPSAVSTVDCDRACLDENCNRIEDGTATTHNDLRRDYSEGANIMRMGCAEQFKTGFFRYVTRIRDRRFMCSPTRSVA
jgi:hypothetical protein